jgi:hypothetical protein
MTIATRQRILRTNAIYLVLASAGGLLLMDIPGAFFSRGVASGILAQAPYAAVGFVEAHGLALILGILLWRATPERSWHLTAVAVHVLLGTANLVFWQIFVTINFLAMGYVTTALHWLFVVLQSWAAVSATDKSETFAAKA